MTPKFGLGLLFFTEKESQTPTFKILVRTLYNEQKLPGVQDLIFAKKSGAIEKVGLY